MIPERFATEYPERVLELLEAFEPIARERNLLGSFSITLASSVLIVPWERCSNRHPLVQERGGRLQDAVRRLEKEKWLKASFWDRDVPKNWRFSRIMGDPNNVRDWRNEQDQPSFSNEANTIEKRKVRQVFRVLRNALAHGNIVYLDEDGVDYEGAELKYLAFLSRYEEEEERRTESETYRMIAVDEEGFISFVKSWAAWVARYYHNDAELRSG